MARRPRRPSPSNDQLLDTAFERFVELGYEGASIEAITAAAGVAKRTVYMRYKDKEALFTASMQRAIEQWILPLDALRQAETEDLEETLVTIGRLLLDNVLSAAGLRLMQLTSSVSRQMPGIGAHNVEQGTKPTLGYLADLFERRIGPHLRGFADSESAAMAFVNLVVTGPANFAEMGAPIDRPFVERYLQSSVSLFLHGVLPQDNQSFPELESENLHLKKILAETMLQLDLAQNALRQGRSAGSPTPRETSQPATAAKSSRRPSGNRRPGIARTS